MKHARFILIIACTLFSIMSLQAIEIDLPKHKIGNQYFYIYEVQKKDNIYSVCNKLGISRAELVKHNPRADEGIKVGDKIFIPAEVNDDNDNTSKQEYETIHQVQKNETIYAISKTYDTTPEEIVKANPDATDGVKSGDNIIIPVKAETIVEESDEESSDSIIVYTIKPYETISEIIVNFNTTLESLFFLNPKVAPYEYVSGTTIRIKKDDNTENNKTLPQFISYTTNKGETFASIANKFHTTIQALHQANPEIKSVKNKTKLYIPIIDNNPSSISESGIPEGAYELFDSIQDVIMSKQTEISLILPLMLNSESPSKQAQLYTEFYRGFLMALDSKRELITTPLNIKVYDSCDSNDTINSIIKSGRISGSQYIIAPDNAKQFEILAEYGSNTGAKVYNTFIVKNNLYIDNPSIYQLNVPAEIMINKVLSYVSEKYNNEEIIFLSIDKLPEKDIIPAMRKLFIEKKGKNNIHEISMESLSIDALNDLMEAGKSYLIIPTNSSRSMIARINFGLKELKRDRFDVTMSMFGYPEWITYQNDYKDFFKLFNTTIYSRFYTDEESVEFKDFAEKYSENYNCSLINAVPMFGALGYDIGVSLLNDIISYESVAYDGIQNVIKFENENENIKGMLNKSVLFINFTENSINKIVR